MDVRGDNADNAGQQPVLRYEVHDAIGWGHIRSVWCGVIAGVVVERLIRVQVIPSGSAQVEVAMTGLTLGEMVVQPRAVGWQKERDEGHKAEDNL